MTLTPDEIKERLGKGGVTRVAEETETTKGHVSQVIHRTRRHRKVEVVVARRCRMRADDLFPPQSAAA